ncbi:hypothetical protein BGX29_006191 [Mortierella sp. GBA35]|nr:hypothetical protein BGX23_005283 [Mortierella sp. AD031]KAF9107503.1 hypothetical protein BGX29_006191 [Mortierella sp. GBA35]KAG0218442.1 hypothetical protein BGX33_007404 [Mortierella sp. NVP41]
MTRTRTGEHKEGAPRERERRQSKSNFSDIRAIPKKAGAGHGNWGVPGCELNQEEQTSALNGDISTSPAENKITVIDAETFSMLQSNGRPNTTSDGQSAANGEQSSSTEASS